jgi:hypothetical protein
VIATEATIKKGRVGGSKFLRPVLEVKLVLESEQDYLSAANVLTALAARRTVSLVIGTMEEVVAEVKQQLLEGIGKDKDKEIEADKKREV